jgi:hypothetical protein
MVQSSGEETLPGLKQDSVAFVWFGIWISWRFIVAKYAGDLDRTIDA